MTPSVPPSEWEWVKEQLGQAIDAYCNQLTGLTGRERIPNLDWDVAELTAHLASLPGVYQAQNDIADDFVRPESFSRFSKEMRAHIDVSELAPVAELLRSQMTAFVDGIEDPDHARWVYGRQTTDGNVAAAFMTEVIIHGMDLAGIAGPEPTLTSRQALAAVPGLMILSPVFVDARKAAKAAGTYHVRFKGGDTWTQHISESGGLEVKLGRHGQPDATLRIDPATFVLVALGRQSQWIPALTGKMMVSGRRPWKLLRTADITVDGI